MVATGGNKAIVGRPPGGKPSISPTRALRDSVSVLETHAMAAASGVSGVPGGSKTAEGNLPGRNHSASPNLRVASVDLEARPDPGKLQSPPGVVAEKPGDRIETPGVVPESAAKAVVGMGGVAEAVAGASAAKVSAGAGSLNPKKPVADPGASSSGFGAGEKAAGGMGSAAEAIVGDNAMKTTSGAVHKNPVAAPGVSSSRAGAGEKESPPAEPAINTSVRNLRFWEENAARTRNRERGIELKHYPNLMGAREVAVSMDLWHKAVDKLSNALVGTVFGEKPSLGKMKSFVRARWQDPDEAKVQVALLNDGMFLFKFANEELKNDALYGSHLTFNRKPLMFQEWSPDESYERCSIKSIPIWIRLPGMRAHILGEEKILSMIVSVIGKPKKTDGYTADKSKMTFARVCVEVFADQEFPNEVIVKSPYGESFVQKIVYEWIPKRCVNCCSFGHDKGQCDKPIIELELTSEDGDSEDESGEDGSREEDHCDPLGEALDPGDSGSKEVDDTQPSVEESRKGREDVPEDQGGEVVPETQSPESISPNTMNILNNAMDEFEKDDGFQKVVSKKKSKKAEKDKEEEIMDKMLAFAKEGWYENSGARELRSSRNGRGRAFRGGTSRGGMRGRIGNKPPNIQ